MLKSNNLTHELGSFTAAVSKFNILYILCGLKNNTNKPPQNKVSVEYI